MSTGINHVPQNTYQEGCGSTKLGGRAAESALRHYAQLHPQLAETATQETPGEAAGGVGKRAG